MRAKIVQVGSSLGIIIPKKVLDELGLRRGDLVEVTVVKPGELAKEKKLQQEMENFMKIYGPALKRLADN